MSLNKTKPYLFYVLLIILAGIVFIFLYDMTSGNKQKKTENVAISVKTTTAKVITKPYLISLIGLLKAQQKVNITAQINGNVEDIFFHNGQKVKKGQKILRISNLELENQLAGSKIKLDHLKQEYDMYSKLSDSHAVSKANYQEIKSDYRIQKAYYQKELSTFKQTLITAPFDGTLGSSSVTVGTYLSTGSEIIELVNTDNLIASYSVPGELYPLLKVDQKILINSDAYPKKKFPGKVSYVSPIISVNTNTVSVEAIVSNKKSFLTSGMYVRVWQEVGAPKKQIIIPNTAIIPVISGLEVYVIKDNRAEIRKIQTGTVTNNEVTVIKGLKPGDQIITEGQEKLKPGSLVKVIK